MNSNQRIILISGKKQSGKSSLRNYIAGVKLTDEGVISRCNISNQGNLMVPTIVNGQEVLQILDLNKIDSKYFQYAAENIWPYVKNYSLANYLKLIVMDLFGLSYDQCFGTNADKETETNVRWRDIAFALPPRRVGAIKSKGLMDHFLTARQVMEEFGEMCRKINPNCWAESCKSLIQREGYPFVIIDDIRYPNELELFKDMNTISIRLTKEIEKSEAEAENALNDYRNFDLIVDNRDMDMETKNKIVHDFLIEKGWL